MADKESESVSVKWDHHHSVLLQAIKEIYKKEIFTDVRLECEGREVWVHKFILSACSEYFQKLLIDVPHQGSISLSPDVQHRELVSLLDFMYFGEVVVPQSDLAELVNAAEILLIRGLAVPCDFNEEQNVNGEKVEQKEVYKFTKKLCRNNLENNINNSKNKSGCKIKKRRKSSESFTLKEEPIEYEESDTQDMTNNYSHYQKSHSASDGYDLCANKNSHNREMDANPGTDAYCQSSSADINSMLKVFIGSNTPDNRGKQSTEGVKWKETIDPGSGDPAEKKQVMSVVTDIGFVCPDCKKVFQWRSNLTKHMRIHTGEKPYNCNVCSYKTSYSEALKRHMRIHTGEKPYKCDKCDYKCRDYGSLKLHSKKHCQKDKEDSTMEHIS